MSGHSDSGMCPNCGENMSTYSDYKPHDYVSGECMNCGFYYYTKAGQFSLKTLNEVRQEYNDMYDGETIPMLTELPKFDEDLTNK